MIRRFFLFIIIGIGLTACDVEFSDNGDLDGFWQLCSIDTLETGRTGDVREKGLTWAFEGKLLEVRDVQKVHQDMILSFDHNSGYLRTFSPYLVYREEGDLKIDDVDFLRPYGINQLEESFKVLELDGDRMVLESEVVRLSFRKY